MNDNPGDDTGSNDIQQQDLISDDVADAITSAMKGEEMAGASTPTTTVQPSKHRSAPMNDSPPPPPPASSPAEHPNNQPTPQPASQTPPPDQPPAQIADNHPEVTARGSGNVSELYDIKQEALKQLGPLVEHLDQGPEERFETLIMMIRASDDPALIQPAYEAAQAIPDDKKHAQALLDVINEVNYLTRPQQEE